MAGLVEVDGFVLEEGRDVIAEKCFLIVRQIRIAQRRDRDFRVAFSRMSCPRNPRTKWAEV